MKPMSKPVRGWFPGIMFMMAVSDTGCGMSPDIQGKIFDPFFTTKAKGMGTGFGLATVYGIVKQHDGNIWVYSEPGKGASFKVYFPVDAQKRAPDAQTRPGDAPDLSGNESIFVVEDDEMVCDMTVQILQNLGYRVRSAPGASECLRMIPEKADPVDLLITDVIMPEMNGKDLYETLSKTHPDLKVLYMSGYTDDVIAHHGVLEKGFISSRNRFPWTIWPPR